MVLLVLLGGMWPTSLTALDTKNYVELEQLGRRYGLKATWTVPGRKLQLKSEWTTLEFTGGSREIAWNGIRVFLGESVVAARRSLNISPKDLETTLVPLLNPVAVAAPGRLKIIAIDAGHGGNDPGTGNSKLKLNEKTFTLDVALRLKRSLEQQGYRVVLTRSTDVRLAKTQQADLERRAEVANRAGADLFISIHFNSLPANAKVSGIETYALPPAGLRSTASHLHTKSNNKVQPGNRYDHWNMVLNASVHREMLDRLKAVDRGIKRARFVVLCAIKCPAVLIEGGFLSHPTEARNIASPAYREKLAQAIAAGVERYSDQLEKSSARPAS